MASILRSSKFVRYIAGFARNVVLNTPREFDGNLINSTQCLCGAIPRAFASQIQSHEPNLEQSLRRLDQDVRKMGRISRRDIEDILEEIRNTRSATSSQSLLVIRCCGNLVPEELPEIRTKLVQEIWSTLHKLNVPMDVSHYNALLRVYLENEHLFSPTEFLADLESKGIEPNRVTYQRLISRYCQAGDIEGATKILEFMREKQLPVNENVFNALIVGHSQTGDLDSAEGILAVMSQAGLEPSADTYTTLLCGYGRKGDLETIQKLLEDCETKEIYLLDKDYLDIIYALATNGHEDQISAIIPKLRRNVGYNHDAINVILRLINKGQENAAYAVLETIVRGMTPDGALAPVGNFFIRQLIKADRPIDVILKFCNRVEENGMYMKATSLATEMALESGKDQIAYVLLEELAKRDVPIRQHYFWPLIVAKAQDESGFGVVDILLKMQSLNIHPSAETIREYVLPNLKKLSSSEKLDLLRRANVSLGLSGSSLVYNLLQRGDLKEAALISTQVSAYYHPDLLKRPLTQAFYETRDLKSYIRVVRNICEHLERGKRTDDASKREGSEGGPEMPSRSEIVGSIVLDLATNRNFLLVLEDVLKMLVEEGLSISTDAAEKIQEKLGEKMNDTTSTLLGRLSSGELVPTPLAKKQPAYVPSHQMNIEQLQRLIHNLQAKGQDTKGYRRQLFSLYAREKNLVKAEELLQEFDNEGFVYSPGLYAQLVALYAQHDNIEKSLFFYNKLKDTEGDFIIDEAKTLELAHAFIRNGQLDEGVKIIENTPRDPKPHDRSFAYVGQVWRFLNALAEEGRTEDLNKVFNTLVQHQFIEVNNVLLGPLIKVHLVNNDFPKALEKFEWCVREYRATPWKSDLTCHLIQAEDADNLQKLTDLSTTIHGEINSLYDLVFAFVECGRLRQARKILETPGLQNRTQRINLRCERYRQEGNVKTLEDLRDATKDLDHINRLDIYYQLLLSYIKQDDPEKALGLWTQMQEEDILPNDVFLRELGGFLQGKGVQVPFQIPIQEQAGGERVAPQPAIRRRLKTGDLDAALQAYYGSNSTSTLTDTSLLIEKLVQSERVGEATKIAIDVLDRNLVPLARVFKFLLNKLASAGDVESLTIIDGKLSQEDKKNVSFDNRLCHANLVAGKAEDYLRNLEREIDGAKDQELKGLEEKFPRGGAFGILEKHPELLGKYETVAVKYGDRGIVAPLNVLWTHYFIAGNGEKADEIWNNYLKNVPRIMFQRIVHSARDHSDEKLIKKLIQHLKISNVTEGAIGNAYSCLLDVLVNKQQDQDVVEAFEAALKDVGLQFINRTAVIRVKESYEKLGKTFTHGIPPKHTKNLTSSSSSSDDARG